MVAHSSLYSRRMSRVGKSIWPLSGSRLVTKQRPTWPSQLISASPEEIAAAAREAAPQSDQTVSVHMIKVAAASGRIVTVRAMSPPHFGLGGSVVSTAAPAAAAVRLLARGSLSATGVLPPERCVDPDELFAELERRGCRFSLSG